MKSENKIYQIYYSYSKYGGVENYINNIIQFSKYKNIKINLENHSYLKFSNFRFLNPVIKNINKENCHLHFHGFNPTIIFEIYRMKNNSHIIWTPHFHPPKFTNRKLLSNLNLVFAYLLLKSKKINVICQHNDEKLFLKAILKNSNFHIIPTGHKFKKVKKKKKIFDAIYIARNEKHKNLDLYIKLVKKFKKQNFCLITNKINLNIKNLKIYLNINNIKKDKLINCSRFFVNTSNFEAFGISSAESELCGVPSIHNSNIKYHMLEKKGETLLLYKKNSLKSLVKIFNTLLNLKKKDYNILCKSRIKFSKKYIFQKQIKVFDRLFLNIKNKTILKQS